MLRRVVREIFPWWTKRFDTSERYWLRRYRWGGNSGAGSRGRSAEYKASYVNQLCASHNIDFVGEIGCGDGYVASLLDVPWYVGYDISPRAVAIARKVNAATPHKRFEVINSAPSIAMAEVMLSMDVAYHLIEDQVLDDHLADLGRHSDRLVLIYGTDHEARTRASHVLHRNVSGRFLQINEGWEMVHREPNPLYGKDWWRRPHFMVFSKTRPVLTEVTSTQRDEGR